MKYQIKSVSETLMTVAMIFSVIAVSTVRGGDKQL